MRYIVHTDGGSRGNPGIAGYGVVIQDESGGRLEISEYVGHATNNEAEYLAVVGALETIAEVDPDALVEVRADSKLVVEQMSGAWKIKKPELQELALRARRALPIGNVTYRWVPREDNSAADALANKAMDALSSYRSGLLEAPSGPPNSTASPASRPPTSPDSQVPTAQPATRVEGPARSASDASQGAPSESSSTRQGSPTLRVSGAARYEGVHDPVTLVFVRHGVSEMTESGAFSGGTEPGPKLSRKGRDQAGRVARMLGGFTHLWPDLPAPSVLLTSPMVRAKETAAVIAKDLRLKAVEQADLREADFGEFQGLNATEIEALYPGMLARWHTDHTFVIPGGTSLEKEADRVEAVVRRVLEDHPRKTVVLVCHAVVIKLALGRLLGTERPMDVRVPAASVSIVQLWPDAAELVACGVPSELSDGVDGPLLLF